MFQEDLPCLSGGFLPHCGDSIGVHSLSPMTENVSPTPIGSLACRDRCGDTLKPWLFVFAQQSAKCEKKKCWTLVYNVFY